MSRWPAASITRSGDSTGWVRCRPSHAGAAHGYAASMFGLPDHITTCLFDLDGVLTPTAEVHDRAWREMFDEILAEHARAEGVPFVPFDPDKDYATYVDGQPRADGVRDF